MLTRYIVRLLWIAAPGLGLLAASCDPALCPPCTAADSGRPAADSRGTDRSRPGEAGPTETGAGAGLAVLLTGAHSHVYKTVVLQWAVRDLSSCTDPKDTKTCKGVPGLPVVALSRAPGAGKPIIEQPLQAGKLDDNGDGTYAQTRTFALFGAYAVGLKFERDGRTQFSFFPYETSRAGGEKYFCDVDKNSTSDVSFQIRWNASAETIVADGSEITFSLELMRSFNTPIDTTSPWTNQFNHLLPATIGGGPTIRLMADKGASAKPLDTMTPVYRGKGIYEVKRKFAAADLGGQPERTFWLEVSFTDDAGCLVKGSADPEEYYFPVAAKK